MGHVMCAFLLLQLARVRGLKGEFYTLYIFPWLGCNSRVYAA